MFYDRNLEFKHKETTQSNDMPAKILKSKDNILNPISVTFLIDA